MAVLATHAARTLAARLVSSGTVGDVVGTGARLLPGIAATISPARELAVVLCALGVIGSIPCLPILTFLALRRARDADGNPRWRVWLTVMVLYVFLVFVPVRRRPGIMRGRLWAWWLEYLSVRVAYRTGEPLPEGRYIYCLVPHGLYPFAGAMSCVSEMMDVFPNLRMAVAPIGLWLPILRHLMGWIGCIGANRGSMARALDRGDSVGLIPGGIAEMMRTEGDSGTERIVLQGRKGFVRLAMELGVPIVPVYAFGNSVLFGQIPMPQWLERLSRWLRVSVILPYGRLGLLIPRKKPLLFAIGRPIDCSHTIGAPTAEQVDAVHATVASAVSELYEFYKGSYGWAHRSLSIE